MNAADPDETLLRQIADRLMQRGERLACAESCTGGLIAARCTELPGSSAWFERGLVTYSNAAKQELLGVSESALATHGAVSADVVLEMAAGLLARSAVDWTLAVSGIAGPDGGSEHKPVGTVWIAWAGRRAAASASRFLFSGDRAAVRARATEAALRGLLDLLLAAA
jgi:competence/damage-inducible protein CinA C-terminal domain